jgi:hypothetical protein
MAIAKQTNVKLNKDEASLWKLLSAREIGSIQQGVDIACSLGDEISGILAGVEVRASTGELLRGSRFSGTGPAQPYLDFALMGILSGAMEGSKASQIKTKVRKLVLTIPSVPSLKGFSALEDLQLVIQDGCHLEDLKAFDAFPALSHLLIRGEQKTIYGEKNSSLASLRGLDAPMLRVASLKGVDLLDLGGLGQGGYLEEVDLSGNEKLQHIDSLESSAGILRSLNLSSCKAIKNIDSLRNSQKLEHIDLSECECLESIKGLTDSIALNSVELVNCKVLASLDGLNDKKIIVKSASEYDETKTFSLAGCETLVDLKYFPDLGDDVDSLILSNMEKLKDISGISVAPYVTQLDLSWSGIEDLACLREFTNLTDINLTNADCLVKATPLGDLKNLNKVDLTYSGNLKILPSTWGSPLTEISLRTCKSLESIQGLPESLNKVSGGWKLDIDLSGCSSLRDLSPLAIPGLLNKETLDLSECDQLKSLNGLEKFHEITLIKIPSTIEDAIALNKFQNLSIDIDLGDQERFPKSLAKALSQLDSFNLVVKGFMLNNCSAIADVTGLKNLDVSECYELKSIKFVVGLNSLVDLRISKTSPAFKEAGSHRFENQTQIFKLQERICEKYKLAKPVRQKLAVKAVSPAVKSALFKAIKPLIISNKISDVLKALKLIGGCSDPELFDALVDGVNTSQLFSGGSDALGKIFKATLQADRNFSRWKILFILSLAPDSAKKTIVIRDSIRSIIFNISENLKALPTISLEKFKGLTSIEFEAFPEKDLTMLSGAKGIEKIIIRDCPHLISFAGIEAASNLQSLEIRSWNGGLPLTDASALANKPKLSIEDGALDLSCWGNSPGYLEGIEFVSNLKSVKSLTANIAQSVSLKPLLEAPWIKTFSLKFENQTIETACLKNAEDIRIEVPDLEFIPKKEWGNPVSWKGTFQELTSLSITNGAHNLSEFRAPKIATVNLTCVKLENLIAFSGASELQIMNCVLPTLSGIENCNLTSFDLCWLDKSTKDIEPLKKVSSVVELRITSAKAYSPAILKQLQNFSQVQTLHAGQYSGSLLFLTGWDNVKTLDLRSSGDLEDLEVLNTLPKLEKIRLNGAKMKRDSWPKHLQTLLDYKSTGW